MNYRIDGGNLPVLKVFLAQGEQIECEAGAMSWMDDEIEMQTSGGGLQDCRHRICGCDV